MGVARTFSVTAKAGLPDNLPPVARTHTVIATTSLGAASGAKARTHTVRAIVGGVPSGGAKARTHTVRATVGAATTITRVWAPIGGRWVQVKNVYRPKTGAWVTT